MSSGRWYVPVPACEVHLEPVTCVYRPELYGWQCPGCGELLLTDEMAARLA